jgi:hypothetical protein
VSLIKGRERPSRCAGDFAVQRRDHSSAKFAPGHIGKKRPLDRPDPF